MKTDSKIQRRNRWQPEGRGMRWYAKQGGSLRGISLQLFNKEVKLCVVCVLSHSVMSDFWQLHGLQPTRLLCPWESPGKSTGVGNHFLIQGIFPTQGSNPGPLYCSFFTVCDTREAQICAIYSIKNKINIIIIFFVRTDDYLQWGPFHSVCNYHITMQYT